MATLYVCSNGNAVGAALLLPGIPLTALDLRPITMGLPTVWLRVPWFCPFVMAAMWFAKALLGGAAFPTIRVHRGLPVWVFVGTRIKRETIFSYVSESYIQTNVWVFYASSQRQPDLCMINMRGKLGHQRAVLLTWTVQESEGSLQGG